MISPNTVLILCLLKWEIKDKSVPIDRNFSLLFPDCRFDCICFFLGGFTEKLFCDNVTRSVESVKETSSQVSLSASSLPDSEQTSVTILLLLTRISCIESLICSLECCNLNTSDPT